MILNKIVKAIKIRRSVFLNYKANKSKSQLRDFNFDTSEIVIFDLRNNGMGRYYYPLIYSFYLKGYSILLVDNYQFIGNCYNKDAFIFDIPKLLIKKAEDLVKFDNQNLIFISDNADSLFSKARKFKINFDVFSDFKAIGSRLFPFPMAHDSYHQELFKEVDLLRDNQRKVRVFFSGNLEGGNYLNPFLTTFFNVLTRPEAIDIIKYTVNKESISYISNSSDYEVFDSNTYVNKIFLTEWTWSVKNKSGDLNSRIDNSKWLRMLSKTDFFLCLPGTRIPHCHNLIETMSVGTIPILEYGSLMFPALEHMENCIAFSGKEDLISKINMVLNMSDQEIARIRKNVIHYYENYLKPECFIANIEHMDSGDLYMIASGKSAEIKLSKTHS